MTQFHLSHFLVLGHSLVLSLVKFCLFNKNAIKKINSKTNNKPILDHICTIRVYSAFQEFTFVVRKNLFTLKFVFADLTKRYFVKIHQNLHFSAKVRKYIHVKSSHNETLTSETVAENLQHHQTTLTISIFSLSFIQNK